MVGKYKVEFTVEGTGSFPLDMLRYDHCWPAYEEDIHWMNTEGKRSVRIAMHVEFKTNGPTIKRWNSFGWTVDLIHCIKL